MRLKASDSVCKCNAKKPTATKLRANGRNNSYHCCAKNVVCCCVRVAVADTTTPYNMQQGVQTDETCNIQQGCVRLHGVLNQLRRGNKITKTDSLGEGFLNGCTNQVI